MISLITKVKIIIYRKVTKCNRKEQKVTKVIISSKKY
jgi:hypothetical protein